MNALHRGLICALCTVWLAAPATADERINWIAAKVNGEIITWADIHKTIGGALDAIRDNDLLPATVKARKLRDLREGARRAEVERVLQLQAARKQRVKVDDKAIETELKRRVEAVGGDAEARQMAVERGITWAEFRQMVREDMTIKKFMFQKLGIEPGGRGRGPAADNFIRPADIRQYYQDHPEEFRITDAVRLRRISVRSTTKDREGALPRAEAIRDQLVKGAAFEEVARMLRIRHDGKYGIRKGTDGTLTWPMLERKALAGSVIEEAAFSLEVGRVSRPIATETGYVLIRVEKRRTAHKMPFKAAQTTIRRILLVKRRMASYRRILEELREKAVIELPKLKESKGLGR